MGSCFAVSRTWCIEWMLLKDFEPPRGWKEVKYCVVERWVDCEDIQRIDSEILLLAAAGSTIFKNIETPNGKRWIFSNQRDAKKLKIAEEDDNTVEKTACRCSAKLFFKSNTFMHRFSEKCKTAPHSSRQLFLWGPRGEKGAKTRNNCR